MLDVTARKRAERERQALLEREQAARAAAEQAGRMRDEFLATLSHELRTPLNAILGWTHILSKGLDDRERAQRGIEVIERNARVQTQLISDLLDVSRITTGKLRLDVQRVELPVVIDAALEAVRPAADAKGVRLQTVIEPVVEPVHGDPSRLQQIIWNLVSNAVKFTPKGGRVQVVLARVNSHVEIRVSDTGEGIDAKFLPHLFRRFTQADASASREHTGLGLGLALVKQLAEMHGGRVAAASEGRGKGATFVVELPLAIIHTQAEEERRVHPHTFAPRLAIDAPRLDGIRVLVVDDEGDALEMTRHVLEHYGATVETAGSADAALASLGERRFDALLSDIGMPRKDGFQFITEARRAGHRLPAAALTAFARSEDRTRALMSGYQAHVAKPVEPAELVATIVSLTGRSNAPG
jgi:CheY-like chemotaxis protein/nitrogen-specific signal transduction histidine kinase